MVSAVETMAYRGETPWHGLGDQVTTKMTPKEMAKAAKINWTVSKQPLLVKHRDGKYVAVPDQFALTRDSDETVLDVVGKGYKPVQNEIALDFFTKFVKAGHMEMETVGSLWHGRYIWALANINKTFDVGKGDEVRNYLLLSNPHVHGKAMLFLYTAIRVVCWNTLTWALGEGLKKKGTAFRMPHSIEFDDDVKKQAEIALGLATTQAGVLKDAATVLGKKKAKADAVEEFFCEVLEFDPKQAVKKKSKEDEVKEPRMLPKFRAALTHSPGHDLISAAGTWWGAVNAVTYVIDHEVGRDNSTALKSAWLGSKSRLKARAFDLALARAK